MSALIARDPNATGLRSDLRTNSAIEFYCDESSQNDHRFLVIGSLAVVQSQKAALCAALAKVREKYQHTREVGWTVVSNYKRGFYSEWLAVFRSFAKRRYIRMTALIMDTQLPANKGWDTKNSELGFNKLVYHLLLHRVGRKYGMSRLPIYGYLDSRCTKHLPEDLVKMLNNGLYKEFKIRCSPFRRIVFEDSKKSDLIQLVDLLIGGIAYVRNDHGSKLGARQAKIDLSYEVESLHVELEAHGTQFSFWEWEYKHRVPRA